MGQHLVPRSATTLLRAGLALIFGAVVVVGAAVSIAVPLYLPTCPCPSFIYSNIPVIAVLPFLVGPVAALAWPTSGGPGLTVHLLRGLALGVLGALYGGIAGAAAIPFHDDYFALVYRLYGLVFMAGATALVSGWSWRTVRTPGAGDTTLVAWPMLATCALTVAAMLIGERPVGASAAAGLAVGVAAAELLVRDRLRPIHFGARTLIVLLLGAAFAVRVVFGLQLLLRNGAGMAFAIASDDGDAYYLLATSIAKDAGNLPEALRNAAFPPMYSVFTGAVFALTRESIAALIMLQAAIAVGATYVVYRLGTRVAGRAVGFVAATLFAFSTDVIHSQTTLTAEALLIPFLIVALWAFARYGESGHLRWLLLAAVALGAAYVTRNLAILLGVAAVGWIVANGRGRPLRVLRDTVVIVAVVVLFALPTALATASAPGGARLTNQLAALASDVEVDGVAIDNRFLVRRGISPLADPFGSLGRFASDPLPVLGFYAVSATNRLSAFLFFASPGSFDLLSIVNPVLYENRYGQLLDVLFAISLVLACAVFVVRRPYLRHPELGLFFAFALLYIGAFTFLFVPSHPYRYRLPVTPILNIAEAALFVAMVRYAISLWDPRASREAGVSKERAP